MFSGQWPLLFQKGSWCTSQLYQQLPSGVDIAQCPFQAGLRVSYFITWCSANFVHKNHYFCYVVSNLNWKWLWMEVDKMLSVTGRSWKEKVWEIQKLKLKMSCFCWKEAKVCGSRRWRMLNTREVILRGDFWVFLSVLFWTDTFLLTSLMGNLCPNHSFS